MFVAQDGSGKNVIDDIWIGSLEEIDCGNGTGGTDFLDEELQFKAALMIFFCSKKT